MRAVAYYFTGTGNTKRVLEKLKAEWEGRGHEMDLVRILPDTKPAPGGYDRLIVGYPVHGFNAPTPIYRFLKMFPKIPKGEHRDVFLLRTSGEPLKLNHASGIVPARILKRRGYKVVGEFYHVMPYNIIFRHPDGMVARMEGASNLKIPRDTDDLEAGSGWRAKVNPFRRAFSFMVRIEHPAMPAIGIGFRAKKKLCMGCGKCEKVCPRGNITMKNGRPKFGGHCVGCMACAFLCPKDAVRTSVLNAWRVNSPYSFEGEPVTDDKVIRYCRRSYLRYFHETEAITALPTEDEDLTQEDETCKKQGAEEEARRSY